MPKGSSNSEQVFSADMFKVSPVWAEDEFERLEPLMEYDPLPQDRPTLYLSVEFVTPGGTRIPGCVSVPARHFAVVFVGDESIYLNANLRSPQDDVETLRRIVNVDDPIFPLTYSTRFHYRGKPDFRGEFSPKLTAPLSGEKKIN